MSGGMDIDWNLRDRILANAKNKFGDWSRDDIIKYSDQIFLKIKDLESEEQKLYKRRYHLRNEQDEIFAILRDKEIS